MEVRENNFGKIDFVTLDKIEEIGTKQKRIFDLRDNEHVISASYRIVKEIWTKYGSSRSPVLTQDQFREFLRRFLELPKITDNQYEKIFKNFDVDGTGHITQLKMLSFILVLSGFPEVADLDLLE